MGIVAVANLIGIDRFIPYHPAADWGHISAATDWNFHEDEVERLAEIMSRHAPYETDELWSDYGSFL